MKKLIIAVASLAMGYCASAGCVLWNTGNFVLPGEGGKGWDPSGAVIADLDPNPGYTAILTLGASYMDGAIGDIIDLKTNGSTSEIDYFGGGMSVTDADLDIAGVSGSAETPYWGQIVITRASDGATLSSEIFQVKSNTMVGGLDFYGMDFEPGSVLKADGSAFSSSTIYGDAGWQSVPEPTSGLLLLLGVAGLALKRKRA